MGYILSKLTHQILEDARLLSQEGDLITNIKGVGKEEDFKMDEYIAGLDRYTIGSALRELRVL